MPIISLSNLHRYNSILFPVTGATAYIVAVTSPEFQKGGTLLSQISSMNRPDSASDSSQYSILLELQQRAQRNELVELTKEECLHKYLPNPQKTQYRNLIVISDGFVSNDSVAWIYYSNLSDINRNHRICAFGVPHTAEPSLHGSGDAIEKCFFDAALGDLPPSRCLAEPATSPCALKYTRNVHLAVIAANLVKVIAMGATLFLYRTPALVTVGDAIASFLETPDPTTQGLCLCTNEDFATETWTPGPKRHMIPDVENLRQSAGAPHLQWVITSAMYVALQSVRLNPSSFPGHSPQEMYILN